MTGKNQIFNNKRFILSIQLCFWLLTGCSTGFRSIDYDYSIQDIQKAVVDNLPEGLGSSSPNRREFYSKPFNIEQEKKGKLRLIAKVNIFGDRRPYSLGIEVRKTNNSTASPEEAFDLGTPYEGEESLAKRIATKIDEQLAQRRKNKNMFDDFRPF